MEKNKCVVAISVALKKAFEIAVDEAKNTACSEDDLDQAIHSYLAKMLGVKVNPHSKCDVLLEKPVTKEVCRDFYEQRRWVMCRAHRKLKEWLKEGKPADLGKALEESWDELKEECERIS